MSLSPWLRPPRPPIMELLRREAITASILAFECESEDVSEEGSPWSADSNASSDYPTVDQISHANIKQVLSSCDKQALLKEILSDYNATQMLMYNIIDEEEVREIFRKRLTRVIDSDDLFFALLQYDDVRDSMTQRLSKEMSVSRLFTELVEWPEVRQGLSSHIKNSVSTERILEQMIKHKALSQVFEVELKRESSSLRYELMQHMLEDEQLSGDLTSQMLRDERCRRDLIKQMLQNDQMRTKLMDGITKNSASFAVSSRQCALKMQRKSAYDRRRSLPGPSPMCYEMTTAIGT